MIKDLDDKTFKHYIYIEHFDIVLNFARSLKPEKAASMTFSKELRISKKYLI